MTRDDLLEKIQNLALSAADGKNDKEIHLACSVLATLVVVMLKGKTSELCRHVGVYRETLLDNSDSYTVTH